MSKRGAHEKRFHGNPGRLSEPDRIALLEVGRVVDLSVEGVTAESLLDVGVGTGVFAEAFSGLGLKVTGLDANAAMLEVARTLVPSARFAEGLAEELPLDDRSFDLVFLGHVLHETDDPLKALVEAKRVARKRVLVLEWPYREEEQGPPLSHRLRSEAILALADAAGFHGGGKIVLRHMDFYRLTP
jgi:ubiquinone/menaquinone biosynthesis C-methylase UbiE